MFHLPDLPTAGTSTTRERELTDSIMLFMRDIERDRLRLLTIVIEGPDKWRTVARAVWGAFRAEDELLDEIYRYFTLQAAWPTAQRALLNAGKDRDKWNRIVKAIMPRIEKQREDVKLAMKWSPFGV